MNIFKKRYLLIIIPILIIVVISLFLSYYFYTKDRAKDLGHFVKEKMIYSQADNDLSARIYSYDFKKEKKNFLLQVDGGISSVKISPNKKYILIIGYLEGSGQNEYLYNLQDGKTKILKLSSGYPNFASSFAWDNNEKYLYYFIDKDTGDPKINDHTDPKKLFLYRYNLETGQKEEIANYFDITNVDSYLVVNIDQVDGNIVYLNSWGEDLIYNIRIWKYNISESSGSLIADLRDYQNEKYKKSQLIGWKDADTLIAEAGLNDAGTENRLITFSVSKKEVREIGTLNYGYTAFLSPDKEKIIYLREDALTTADSNKSLELYDFLDNATRIYYDYGINRSVWLVKWLPDSKYFLFHVDNEYLLINTMNGKTIKIQMPDNIESYNIYGWF